MKKAILYTLIGGILCIGNMPAAHAESTETLPPHVVISEIQTGGTQDATEEFVELFNLGEAPVDITGWQLQYRAASGTPTQNWPASSTKATLACPEGSESDCRVVLAPNTRAVLVHTLANIAGSLPMSGGFSSTGGQIRLVQPGLQPVVHDFVGYGTAVHAEGTPAAAPSSGASIKRITTSEGIVIDTNNNAADFIANCGNPTPGSGDSSPLPLATGCTTPTISSTEESETPSTDTDPTPTTETSQNQTATYLPLIITEIMPDPASPQQDNTDEFIEVYNPNDSAVTLKDYRLQTGSDYRYSFTLGDTPLGPHSYLAIPSAVSKLSLANSGSGVRLIDPAGTTAYEVPNYGTAKEGQSWMQDDQGWHWTLTPTPGAANILSMPVPKVAATAAKKAPAKKASTKVTAPKVPKAPAAKKKTTEQPPKTPAQQAATTVPNPQYWLLVPLGTLAAGYAAYEYRHDLSRAARKGWSKVTGNNTPPES